MMQAQTPRDSGIGRAARTAASGGDLEQAARAIYAAFDPAWHTGRDDSAGEMQLQLRPPTDLRGNTAAHVLYDAAVLGQLAKGGLHHAFRQGRVAKMTD